jgi:hypothetical protein
MTNERMKEYKISSFADIVQALRENPEWLEELRRLILTQELLKLPNKFADFRSGVGRRFEAIEKKGKGTKKNVNEIRQRLDKHLNAIEKEVQEVKRNFNEIRQKLEKDLVPLKNLEFLKGLCLEIRVMDHVSSLFSEHLINAKVIDQEEIKQSLSLAMKKGVISKEEIEEVLRLDLIVEGTLLSTKEPVLLAVEVSCMIDRNDVERAVRRAEILRRAMGQKVLPMVVGYRISKQAQKLINKRGCLKVLVHA